MQCKLRFPLLQHMISISTRSMFPAPAPPSHSEGESLCGGEKMRLGGNVHPQNGDIGGCKASRVATEDYIIDQVRTLGGPDHISCWATSS